MAMSLAAFIENAGTVWHARDFRRELERLMGYDVVATSGTGAGGIFRTGDLAVTQRGAGANMSVDVALGAAYVDGNEATTQGGYFAYNDAVTNLAIAAADAVNPRIDIVGVRVRDTEYSGATNDGQLVVVTGTPAAIPAEPALPSNFLTLARVDVAALAASITNANITNRRRMMSALGGIAIATSTTRPTTNLWEGLFVYETDTHALKQYTTGTTLWTPPWNLPWGILAYSSVIADQTLIAVGPTALTGFTATYASFVANRRIRLRARLLAQQKTVAGNQHFYYYRDAALIIEARYVGPVGPGNMAIDSILTEEPEHIDIPAAGSHTYDLRGGTSAGTMTIWSGSLQPGYLYVEDAGPSGAPA